MLKTPGGTLEHKAPVVYQGDANKRSSVGCRYVRSGARSIRLEVEAYDATLPLVIDPVVRYHTTLGGSLDEGYAGVTADSSGAIYLTTEARSTAFPATTGTYAGQSDVTVSKLSADGKTLAYSTFIGGTGSDYPQDIAVDATGSAYVAGYTHSHDYPLVQPLRSQMGTVNSDMLVTKLSPNGGSLAYSTYLGGDVMDRAFGIAVYPVGNAFVAGETDSLDYPTTMPPQGNASPYWACVTKISSGTPQIAYSTKFGDVTFNNVGDIAIDSAGCAYIVGSNSGSGGWVSEQAFYRKLNPSGVSMISKYFGGSGSDQARGVAVDGSGNAYITGTTNSSDFPVSQYAFRRTNTYTNNSAFVCKIDAQGKDVYSTYLGGTGHDEGNSIAVDCLGHVYVAGRTNSSDFPLRDAIQTTLGGQYDGFIVQMNAAGTGIDFATLMGGTALDTIQAIVFDRCGGDAIVVGDTTTPFAFGGSNNTIGPRGARDIFITRLGLSAPALQGGENAVAASQQPSVSDGVFHAAGGSHTGKSGSLPITVGTAGGDVSLEFPVRRFIMGLGPSTSSSGGAVDALAQRGLVARYAKLRVGIVGTEQRCAGADACLFPNLGVRVNGYPDEFEYSPDGIWVPLHMLNFPSEAGEMGELPTAATNTVTLTFPSITPETGSCPEEAYAKTIEWASLEVQAMAPIILVHGIGVEPSIFSQESWTSQTDSLRVASMLQANWVTFWAVDLDDIGTIEKNAEELAEQVRDAARKFGAYSVHLVTVSKGGLDSRAFLANQYRDDDWASTFGPASPQYPEGRITVLSLFTLATPHHGSLLADLSVERRSHGRKYLTLPSGARADRDDSLRHYMENDNKVHFTLDLWFLRIPVTRFGPRGKGLEDLQAGSMWRFNNSDLGTVPTEIPVYTYSGDADAAGTIYNDSNQATWRTAICLGEAMDQFQSIPRLFGHDTRAPEAGSAAYDILRRFEQVETQNADPSRRIPRTATLVPTLQRQNNDLFVSEASSRYTAGPPGQASHEGPFDKNHTHMRDRDMLRRVLAKICCEFPLLDSSGQDCAQSSAFWMSGVPAYVPACP